MADNRFLLDNETNDEFYIKYLTDCDDNEEAYFLGELNDKVDVLNDLSNVNNISLMP